MHHISPQQFYQYFTCPHWPWFDQFGDPSKKGEVSELHQKLLEQGVAHEEKFIAAYAAEKNITHITADSWDEALAQTKQAMKNGAEIIYQGRLRDAHFEGVPDLLIKQDGWYEPVDIKSSHELKDEHKYQLFLYGLLLESATRVRPARAGVITIDGTLHEFELASHEEKFYATLEKIERIVEGEKPPLQLTKACTNSPWFDECVRQAEEADDIALLYKVDKRSLAALHEHGVHTVDDARAMDPAALDGAIPFMKLNGLERMKLQSESLKTGTIITRRTPHIPLAPLHIHFDIEGDPLLGVEYLFGFLIEGTDGAPDRYLPFVAEQPEQEGQMWRAFLDWIATLPVEYVVFHYAPYEASRLTMFSKKYASDMTDADHAHIARFRAQMFDLNEPIKNDFVFPVYFYGLKQIGKLLGFHWDSKKAGGAQSIFWYEQWVETGDRTILETILRYNEDDVRATKFLRDWIISDHEIASP